MKKNRFFWIFLESQEKWLNKMSNKGYRLTGTTIGGYEFEECVPGRYVYAVEYVGNKSREACESYKQFLEDMGYRVYYKNINLDYSVGKVEVRPWADKGGVFATNRTTHNKEIMLVEKEADGKPFELHTTAEDKISYYTQLIKPSFLFVLPCIILGICLRIWILLAVGILLAVPAAISGVKILKLKKESTLEEVSETKKEFRPGYVIIVVVCAVLALIYGIEAGPFKGSISNYQLGYFGNANSRVWSATYKELNGSYAHNLNIKDGALDIEIETKSGLLNVVVSDMDGNHLYEAWDVQNVVQSIPVEGKVRIDIYAEKHKGRYSFK